MELPLVRLGLAGFSAGQQQDIERMLLDGVGPDTQWQVARLEDADAWWVNGERTRTLGEGRIRIASGTPAARSLQLELRDVDRPLAFAQPLPEGLQALCSFDPRKPASMRAVLLQFEQWLAPMLAQFCLAAQVAEHQSALGSGKFELRLKGELLATVDMHGDTSVRATARPQDFEGAIWRHGEPAPIPEDFVRTSLSQLMWQFGLRTERDLLPRHYRSGLLYFRRPPRLAHRLLRDSHLLIMRELMVMPSSFDELQHRCGFDDRALARDLAALYFVGSITSNPKRAAAGQLRGDGEVSSGLSANMPSRLDSVSPVRPDLTAPAPLRPDH